MKKFISTVLALLMLFSALSVSSLANYFQEDSTYTLGDGNNDGNFDAKDANAAKAYIMNGDEINKDAVDIDADGKCTTKDIFYLKSVFAGAKSISDFDSDKRVYKLTIAGNDISEYDMVFGNDVKYYPDDERKSDNAAYAAIILRKYIKKTTGVEVPINQGESKMPHMIYFHNVELYSEEADKLGFYWDDYIYEVKDGDLHIYGTLRGNLYAAYEIIEEYLGLKFYCERATFSKRIRNSDIPEGTYVYHPVQVIFRFDGQNDNTSYVDEYFFPGRNNGNQIYAYNTPSVGYLYGPIYANAHSFGYYKCFYEGDDPGEEYPDGERWYMKLQSGQAKNSPQLAYNWQPCPTAVGANSDFEHMFEGMQYATRMSEAWGNPFTVLEDLKMQLISASINDNGEYCTCRLCSAIATGKQNFSASESNMKKLAEFTGDYTLSADGKYVSFGVEGYSGLYLNLTNRFAVKSRETGIYPNAKYITIIYEHTVPATVRPDENVILWYCGHGCNQHVFGSGECGENTTVIGTSNTGDEYSLKAWADICHEAGTEIFFWEYAVNYAYLLAPAPCVLDFWANYNYIYNVCGVDGMYYEGCNFNGEEEEYNFEQLKAYISDQLTWNPKMTYDEFIATIKDFMYMYYGPGYEYIYQFLEYQQAAGDANEICFVVNNNRPGEMYNYDYIAKHYEEARECLDKALAMTDNSLQIKRIKGLYLSWDFLGLSSLHTEWYLNGKNVALYKQRYTDFYNYIVDNEILIFTDTVYSVPDELDFEENPMVQFYGFGSVRDGITP